MTALAAISCPATGAAVRETAPVALAHLSARTPQEIRDAATALYRQTRHGRRVVAVAAGDLGGLAAAADRIGLESILAEPQSAGLVHQPIVLVEGAVAPREGAPQAARPLRIALAGCGVVGGGLYQRLQADDRFELTGVLVRKLRLRRDPQPDPALLVTNVDALLATRPDVVIDVLSDAEAGLFLTQASLERGLTVVSANKQAVGPRLAALEALAEARGGALLYSAAVGGGAPVIETLLRAREHGEIARVEGVLNGTVNFLLNRLTAGCGFADAVSEAQIKGFAEADPSSDLEGRDAAAKLGILSTLAFGDRSPQPAVQALSSETALPSGPVRQLARSDGRTATIAFEPVAHDALFADLPDEWNALRVTCADGQTFTCRGRGAGRWPTAESVWSDLLDRLETA